MLENLKGQSEETLTNKSFQMKHIEIFPSLLRRRVGHILKCFVGIANALALIVLPDL